MNTCFFCKEELFAIGNIFYCDKCPILKSELQSGRFNRKCSIQMINNYPYRDIAWDDEDLKVRLSITRTKSFIKELLNDKPIFTIEEPLNLDKITPDELKRKIKSIIMFI